MHKKIENRIFLKNYKIENVKKKNYKFKKCLKKKHNCTVYIRTLINVNVSFSFNV